MVFCHLLAKKSLQLVTLCFIDVFHYFVLSLVLTDNQDFNSKLQGLINELRGELGAVLRGSRDARDRLLKSKCTAFSFFGHRANLLRKIDLLW